MAKWGHKYPKLCDWVEASIEETLSFYRLPREHHKHMKSTNMLERLNEEIKRRTHVVRIFPNEASCLRLIRALAVEIHVQVPNRLVGDGDTPLGNQVFDIAKAECEPMVKLDDMADDIRGKPMTSICRFHPSLVAEVGLT